LPRRATRRGSASRTRAPACSPPSPRRRAGFEPATLPAMRCVALAAVVAAMVGCKKEAGFEGMPAADKWNAEQAGGEHQPMTQARGSFHGGSSFHGATGPSEAETDTDDETGGEPPPPPPPDPDRAVDPTHRIAGVIKLGPKAKGKATPGTAVFVVAK